MSLMIRIPTRNTDRRTSNYSTAGYSAFDEWEDWQPPQKGKHAKSGGDAPLLPLGDAASDGISLRQRLQALTRQLRRRSGSSLPNRLSGSSQLPESSSSGRLSVMSKVAKFANTFI